MADPTSLLQGTLDLLILKTTKVRRQVQRASQKPLRKTGSTEPSLS